MTDRELLEAHLRGDSPTAFATLVERHVDLVYSAARRQVRSAHLAEDVAQSVFLELHRAAARIPLTQPLAAWLYVVTRRVAIDTVRRETRRLIRETTAVEIAAMKTPSASWAKIEDSIDEAMASLSETDRAAIVLRFFQNLSLREVGAALGTSDDAAQKRVSRALEQLRATLVRRGAAVTALTLAADLQAHALQGAPAGLGAAIAHSAALTGATASAAAVESSRVLVMTTLQKSLVVAAFVVAGGAGLYETTLAARQSRDLLALREGTDRTAAEVRALRDAQDQSGARLKSVEQQIDARLAAAKAPDPADAALVEQMTGWLTRMGRIKQIFAQRPALGIPELQYLPDERWFEIAGGKPLESDEDARKVASALRRAAESIFQPRLSAALRAYLKAHDDVLPASPQDLAPFCDPPLDRAILDRYEILLSGKLADVPTAKRREVMALKAPADPEFDAYSYISPNGYGGTSAFWTNLNTAEQAFAKANPGQKATSAAQLRPFLRWPMSDESIQKILNQLQGSAP